MHACGGAGADSGRQAELDGFAGDALGEVSRHERVAGADRVDHVDLLARHADRVVAGWTSVMGRSVYRTEAAPIQIGSSAWIGGGTIVMPGVTIGDNVAIGAGSIVTGDIPSNVLAFGQPCRVRQQL
jgi:maltose O-acetyltransferase